MIPLDVIYFFTLPFQRSSIPRISYVITYNGGDPWDFWAYGFSTLTKIIFSNFIHFSISLTFTFLLYFAKDGDGYYISTFNLSCQLHSCLFLSMIFLSTKTLLTKYSHQSTDISYIVTTSSIHSITQTYLGVMLYFLPLDIFIKIIADKSDIWLKLFCEITHDHVGQDTALREMSSSSLLTN